MRTIAIGDIHGGLKALVQLLERVQLSTDDHLIFVGDYVDGWSQSANTIDFLIDLKEQYKCTFILGNHDAWCHDWLKTGDANPTWRMHGGKSTMESYEDMNYTEAQMTSHLAFFDSMIPYYIDEENRLFIHAGFTSMHGPSKEHYGSNYSWDRTLWETAVATHSSYKRDNISFPKRLKLFKEIYIGHTPTIRLNETQPMNRVNVWNVDTGAAFTGPLSAIDIDTKEIWQSDLLTELYPYEKGRNKTKE